jgi:hypothetical protein
MVLFRLEMNEGLATLTDSTAGKQQVLNIGTIEGGKMYSIVCRASPDIYMDNMPTIQQMINSLKITG